MFSTPEPKINMMTTPAQRPFIPTENLSTHRLTDLLPLKDSPIHLDIGTGLGHFLETLAQINFAENWIGLEVDGKILKRAIRRVRRSTPNNTILFALKAMPFLLENVPPQSLDHIWINFPDPWPKKKHANRRHSHPTMLNLLSNRLKIGGSLHLATDVSAYLTEMSTGISALPEFSIGTEPQWRRETLNVQTKYERKWLGRGRTIFYGDWQKTRLGAIMPFEWQPAPTIALHHLPEAKWYGEGRYQTKIFPPGQNTPHQCGFYLIDREADISTPGTLNAQEKRIYLKGAWTPWKIDLMTRVLSIK